MATIYGTNLNDTLFGTEQDDLIIARVGHDIIWGNNGADTIDGNYGNDTINGNAGNDIILGGQDHDSLTGGAGNDTLYGNSGNDTLYGQDNDDLLITGVGHDYLNGGNGNDLLNAGSGDDALLGGKGNDLLLGGNGGDYLDGDSGNDQLKGGKGTDTLAGGEGSDLLYGNSGDDSLGGGTGSDTLYGNSGNDILEGDEGNDVLDGGHGSDLLLGGDGDDTLIGDHGKPSSETLNLVVNGSFEADVVTSSIGWSVYSGITGWNTTQGAGIEQQVSGLTGVYPTDGNQKVELDSHNNSNMWQDIHTNGTGTFTLSFDYTPRPNVGAASNPIEVYWNNTLLDTITGENSGWATHTYQVQGAGTDTRLEFRAVGTSDALGGYLDNVKVTGVVPTVSNDTLEGGEGNDLLIGGYGDDTFVFSGTNIGNDTLKDFGKGADVIDLSALGVTAANLDSDNSGVVDDADALVSVSGGNLLITLTQGTITLAHHTDVALSDFVLA